MKDSFKLLALSSIVLLMMYTVGLGIIEIFRSIAHSFQLG